MSIEHRAILKLKKELPGFIRCGLNERIRYIANDLGKDLEGMETTVHHGFLPDGTRLRKQPALNPDFEPFDYTLELWEIEDTYPLTNGKLNKIEIFSIDLFDLSSVFVELIVVDRYGFNPRLVFDSRTTLYHVPERNENKPDFI